MWCGILDQSHINLEWCKESIPSKCRNYSFPPLLLGFFNGAAPNGACGAGFVIKVEWCKESIPSKCRNYSFPPLLLVFFDGAASDGACGVKFVIKLDNKSFKCWRKDGKGTNTRIEVIGLWSLLHCDRVSGIKHFLVLGDS